MELAEALSLIHISEPTRRTPISYAVFCLKKKRKEKRRKAHLRVKIGLFGERKLNLFKHKNDAERKSDL